MPKLNPNAVDERVVEMRIDNEKFESGAKKTISTLEKLEKALKIKSDTSAIDDLERAASRFDVSPMTSALDKVQMHMSALEVAGLRVIQNLTDEIYNFATKTVKGLTIDQVSEGYNKYEKMVESTQTMMAATQNMIGQTTYIDEDGIERQAQEIEGAFYDMDGALVGFLDRASQMKVIQDYLDGLLWFADETSYSFTDMTDNMGKFLSAGVDIDKAYASMMGIASWGATAGAKPAEVNRALYNISQAMGTGVMQAVDWRSIENANMATLGFKQTAIDVAVAMGKLQKATDDVKWGYVGMDVEVDEFGHIVDKTDGEVEDMLITAENFRGTLNQKWFDKEVMQEVFSRYGMFAEELRNAVDATGLEATEVLQILDKSRKQGEKFDWDKYAKSAHMTAEELQGIVQGLDDIGIAYDYAEQGFRRGQEAKTFTDAIMATKDAVSSRWMKTFQYIFGDYLQATEFWTQVTTELYDMFAAGGDVRNEVLEAWAQVDEFGKSGRDYLLGIEYNDDGEIEFQGALWNLLKAVHSWTEPVKEAFAEVFGLDDTEGLGHHLIELTDRFREFTATLGIWNFPEAQQGIKVAFTQLFSVLKAGLGIVGKAIKIFAVLSRTIMTVVACIFALISGEYTLEDFVSHVGSAFKTLMEFLKTEVVEGLINLKDRIWKGLIGLKDRIVEGLKNAYKAFYWSREDIAEALAQPFRAAQSVIGGIGFAVFSRLYSIVDKVRMAIGLLKTAYDIGGIKGFFGLLKTYLPTMEDIQNGIVSLGDYLSRKFPKLAGFIDSIKDKISALLDRLAQTKVGSFLVGLFTNIGNGFAYISDSLKKLHIDTSGLQKVFDMLAGVIAILWNALFGDIDIAALKERLSKIFTTIKDTIFGELKDWKLKDYLDLIRTAGLTVLLAEIGQVISAFKKTLKEVQGIPEAISGLIGQFGETVRDAGKYLRAKAILNIAIAVGVLSLAFLVLSTIPEDKLTHVAAVTVVVLGVMSSLAGSIGSFSKSVGQFSNNKITVFGKFASALFGIAAVLLALGGMLLIVQFVNYDKMERMFLSVIELVAVIGLMTMAMAKLKFDDSRGVVGSILALALALDLIIPVLVALALMPVERCIQAVFGVIGILGVMSALAAVLAAKKFNFDGQQAKQLAFSMILMALALDLLIPVFTSFALMNAMAFGHGLVSILGILAVLLGLTWALGKLKIDGKKMIAVAAAVLIMAFALNIMVPAISAFSAVISGMIVAVNWSKLSKKLSTFAKSFGSVLGLLAACAAVAVTVYFLGKGLFYLGAGLVLVALAAGIAALVLPVLGEAIPKFVEALQDMQGMSLKDMLKQLGKFAIVVAVIAVAIAGILWLLSRMTSGNLAGKLVSFIGTLLTGFANLGAGLRKRIIAALPELLDILWLLLILAGLALLDKLPDIVEWLVNAVVVLFDSLAASLERNKDQLVDSVVSIIRSVLDVVGGIISELFTKENWDSMSGVQQALLAIGGIKVGAGLLGIKDGLLGILGVVTGNGAAGGGLIGALTTLFSLKGLVAGSALYALFNIHSAEKQYAEEAFAGLGRSVDDYATAAGRLSEKLQELKRDRDNLIASGATSTDMIDAEIAERTNVLNAIYQDLADTYGITVDELLDRATEGGYARRFGETKEATVDLKKAVKELSEETGAYGNVQSTSFYYTEKEEEATEELTESKKELTEASKGSVRALKDTKEAAEEAGETQKGLGKVSKDASDTFSGSWDDGVNKLKTSITGLFSDVKGSAKAAAGEAGTSAAWDFVTDFYESAKSSDAVQMLNGAGYGDMFETYLGMEDAIDDNSDTSAKNTVVSLVNGLNNSGVKNLANSGGKKLGFNIATGTDEYSEDNMPTVAKNIASSLANGTAVAGVKSILEGAGRLISSTVANAANEYSSENMLTVGSNAVIGVVNGINANLHRAASAGSGIGKAVMVGSMSKDGFDENSPSKKMAQVGMYAALGLINGLLSEEGSAQDAGIGIGSAMTNAIAQAMANVALLADEDFSISPLITPVVDMTNVDNAASTISGSLTGGRYSLSGQMGNSVARRLEQAERVASNVDTGRQQVVNSNDTYYFSIYAAEGMDEEEIADAVIEKLGTRYARRGVAFG